MKILIMGLPSSGKTTLAMELVKKLDAVHFNADNVRKLYNDWDFSIEGRLRQATRLARLCNESNSKYVIADFVCPTDETREAFNADFVVWVDRIKASRFEDTNKLFVPPKKYNARIDGNNTMEYYAKDLATIILNSN